MYNSVPPPPPDPFHAANSWQHTPPASKRPRRWPWIIGLIGTLAIGGVAGIAIDGEPEVITKEIEVEPADVGEQRADLDQRAADLDDRENELDTRQSQLDERDTELEELAADLETQQAAVDDQEAAQEDDEESEQTTISGSGTFLVGEDITSGTYSTEGGSGLCYWARLSGLSGEFSDIITNGIPDGQTYVTIAESDVAFETTSCGTWVLQ